VRPSIAELISQFPHVGQVDWIGLRPERKAPLLEPTSVDVRFIGLEGDHRATAGKRAVTLIQAEHLGIIRGFVRNDVITFADLRRNIAVSGINLLALHRQEIVIGTAVLRISGPCAPCSRMETLLGAGGYNAMRGHGGVTAEVVREGVIALGDQVSYQASQSK